MEIAPDFFAYFKATSGLLDADPTLYCVSSWNDHGQQQFVRNETQIHRSDFFPGLGWMMNKQLWAEVRCTIFQNPCSLQDLIAALGVDICFLCIARRSSHFIFSQALAHGGNLLIALPT